MQNVLVKQINVRKHLNAPLKDWETTCAQHCALAAVHLRICVIASPCVYGFCGEWMVKNDRTLCSVRRSVGRSVGRRPPTRFVNVLACMRVSCIWCIYNIYVCLFYEYNYREQRAHTHYTADTRLLQRTAATAAAAARETTCDVHGRY